MRLKKKYIFLWSGLLLALMGCASKEKVPLGDVRVATWESKAQIKDLTKNKTQTVSIDLYAVRNSKLRVEVSATLGYQVASLVMDSSQLTYVIYPQKTFYRGKNSETAFEQVLGIPIHPMNLSNIAFEDPIRAPGWTCSQNEKGLVSQCENRENQTQIKYLSRDDGRKKVSLSSPKFEMIWIIEATQPNDSLKAEIFDLKVPEGYRKIKLN